MPVPPLSGAVDTEGIMLAPWPSLPALFVVGVGMGRLFGEATGAEAVGLLEPPGTRLPPPWRIKGGITLLFSPGPVSVSKGSSGRSLALVSSAGLAEPEGFVVASSLSWLSGFCPGLSLGGSVGGSVGACGGGTSGGRSSFFGTHLMASPTYVQTPCLLQGQCP